MLRASLTITIAFITLVSGAITAAAIWIYVVLERDTAIHCSRTSYHSGECKDIGVVQAYVFIAGIVAVSVFAVAAIILFRLRRPKI